MTKVLIIEEIPILREFATSLVSEIRIGAESLVVLYATDDREAYDLFLSESPNVVIFDASTARSGGMSFAQKLWRLNTRTKIIIWVSTHREAFLSELARVTPVEAVYGYVLKTEGEEKLKYALAAVCHYNNRYVDPQARKAGTRQFASNDVLTDAEFETLTDIMLGLTDRAVAQRRGLTVRGVQNRLATLALKILRQDHWRLRQPQGMEIFNPRTRLVLEALKRGYLTTDQLANSEREFHEWLSQVISNNEGTRAFSAS